MSSIHVKGFAALYVLATPSAAKSRSCTVMTCQQRNTFSRERHITATNSMYVHMSSAFMPMSATDSASLQFL